jgi:hypothetical protein
MTIHCIRSIFTPIVLRKNPSLLYINKDFYEFRKHKTITNKIKTVEYSNIVEIRPVNLTNLYSSVLDISHLDYMFMYLDSAVKLEDDDLSFIHEDTIEYAEDELKRCLSYYNIKERIDWYKISKNTYINIKSYM